MKVPDLKVIYLILLCVSSIQISNAQDEKFKAIFIYNFTKYIEWPAESASEKFTITIFGNKQVENELVGISSKMKVGSKSIVVKAIQSPNDIPETQILFITREKSEDLKLISEAVKSKNVLIIADKPNACNSGAGLNFISKNGNLNFEIQQENIKNAGLTLNSGLLRLGTVL